MNPDKLLPVGEETPVPMTPEEVEAPVVHSTLQGTPSPKAQSWGAVISIIVIVLMVVIGAFYAWGERVSQNKVYPVVPVTDDSGL